MSEFPVTPQNRVRRLPNRAHYDRATIHAIVDEALICHVGFIEGGQPVVIPTIHARQADTLLLHGAKASRLLKQVATGQPLCITITLLDGLVLARSVFHHSMNYRSAVIFGQGQELTEETEKLAALAAFTERVTPGRWAEVRQPTRQVAATAVVAVEITSASAKIRMGGPVDDEEDYALPVWAGVLPLQLQALTPTPDERLAEGISLPEYLTGYARRAHSPK